MGVCFAKPSGLSKQKHLPTEGSGVFNPKAKNRQQQLNENIRRDSTITMDQKVQINDNQNDQQQSQAGETTIQVVEYAGNEEGFRGGTVISKGWLGRLEVLLPNDVAEFERLDRSLRGLLFQYMRLPQTETKVTPEWSLQASDNLKQTLENLIPQYKQSKIQKLSSGAFNSINDDLKTQAVDHSTNKQEFKQNIEVEIQIVYELTVPGPHSVIRHQDLRFVWSFFKQQEVKFKLFWSFLKEKIPLIPSKHNIGNVQNVLNILSNEGVLNKIQKRIARDFSSFKNIVNVELDMIFPPEITIEDTLKFILGYRQGTKQEWISQANNQFSLKEDSFFIKKDLDVRGDSVNEESSKTLNNDVHYDDDNMTQLSQALEPNSVFFLGTQQLPDRPHHLIERKTTFSEFQDLLIKTGFSSVIQVHGVAACGKSLMVNEVSRQLYQMGFWRGVVYVNLQGIQNQQDVAIEICKALEVLNYQTQIPPSQVLTQWLQRKANGYPQVGIILDNVDSFAQWTETWTNFALSLIRLLHGGGSEFQLITTSRFKDTSLKTSMEEINLPLKFTTFQVGLLNQDQAINFLKNIIQPSLPKQLNQQVASACIYNPFVTQFATVNILYGVISPIEIAQINNKEQAKTQEERQQSIQSQDDKRSDITSPNSSPGREKEVVAALANILRICLRGWSERDKLAIFSLTTIPLVTSQELGQRALQCGTSVTRANATFRRLQARGILNSRRAFGEYRMEGILRQALLQPEILQGQMVLLQGGAMVSSLICVQSTQQVLLQFFADRLRMVCMQIFGGLGLSAYHLIAREIQIINWAIQIASQGHPAAAEALKSIQQSILWGGASVLPLHLQNLLLQALVDQPMWQGSEATRKSAEVMRKLVAYKILADQGKPNLAQGYLTTLEELIQNEEQLDLILLGRALLLLGNMWIYMRKPIYSIQKIQKALDLIQKPLQKISKIPNPDWQVQDTTMSHMTGTPLSAPFSQINTMQSDDTLTDNESVTKSYVSTVHSPDNSMRSLNIGNGRQSRGAKSMSNFSLKSMSNRLKLSKSKADDSGSVITEGRKTSRRRRQKQPFDDNQQKQIKHYFRSYFNKQIQPTEKQIRREKRKQSQLQDGDNFSDTDSLRSLQNPTKRLFRAFAKQQKQQNQQIIFPPESQDLSNRDKKLQQPIDGSTTPQSSQIGAASNPLTQDNIKLGLGNSQTNKFSQNSNALVSGSSSYHDPFGMLKSRRVNNDRLNQQIYLVDVWDTEEFQLEVLRLDLLVEYAEALRALRQYEEAERQLKLAHYYASTYLGYKHPKNAVILLRLGQLDLLRGAPQDAQKHLSQALLLHRHHEGLYGKHVFTILKLLVQACRQQNQYQQALDLAEECLMVVRLMLGPDTPNEAEVSYQVAQIQEDQGNYAGALVSFCASLRIKEMVLGSYDRSVLKTVLHIIKVKKALATLSGVEDYTLTKLRRKTKSIIKQQKFGRPQNGENQDFTSWIELLKQFSPELFESPQVPELWSESQLQNMQNINNLFGSGNQNQIQNQDSLSFGNQKVSTPVKNKQSVRMSKNLSNSNRNISQIKENESPKSLNNDVNLSQYQSQKGSQKPSPWHSSVNKSQNQLKPIKTKNNSSNNLNNQVSTPARSENEVFGSPYGSDNLDNLLLNNSGTLQQRENQNRSSNKNRNQGQGLNLKPLSNNQNEAGTPYVSPRKDGSSSRNTKSNQAQSEYYSEEEQTDASNKSKNKINDIPQERFSTPQSMKSSLKDKQDNKQPNQLRMGNTQDAKTKSNIMISHQKKTDLSIQNKDIEQQLSQKIDSNWKYLKSLMLEAKHKNHKDQNYNMDFASEMSADESKALSNYLNVSKLTNKNSGEHEISELFHNITKDDRNGDYLNQNKSQKESKGSPSQFSQSSQEVYNQIQNQKEQQNKQQKGTGLQQVQENTPDDSLNKSENGYIPKFKNMQQENSKAQPGSKQNSLAQITDMLPTPGERVFKQEDSSQLSQENSKMFEPKGKQFSDLMDDLDHIITRSELVNDKEDGASNVSFKVSGLKDDPNPSIQQDTDMKTLKSPTSLQIDDFGQKTTPQILQHKAERRTGIHQVSQSSFSNASMSPRDNPVSDIDKAISNQRNKSSNENLQNLQNSPQGQDKKIRKSLKNALIGNKVAQGMFESGSNQKGDTAKPQSNLLQGPLRHKAQARVIKQHSQNNLNV